MNKKKKAQMSTFRCFVATVGLVSLALLIRQVGLRLLNTSRSEYLGGGGGAWRRGTEDVIVEIPYIL